MDKQKQQTLVVGALVVVMLGIGVFQFSGMSGGEAPNPAAKPAEESKEGKEKDSAKEKPAKNPMYSSPLVARDPFAPAQFAYVKEADGGNKPPVPAPSGAVTSNATPLPSPVPMPPSIGGDITPLPSAGANGVGSLAPAIVEAPVFALRLTGTITGNHPAAFFEDASGRQRMVSPGSPIDPDTELLAIGRGWVKVRFHGKTLRLTPKEGQPKDQSGRAPSSVPGSSRATKSKGGSPADSDSGGATNGLPANIGEQIHKGLNQNLGDLDPKTLSKQLPLDNGDHTNE